MAKVKARELIHIKRRPRRIWELDVLRGVSIILMVVDHCMLDFMHLNELLPKFSEGAEWLIPLQRLGNWYWYSDFRDNLRGIFVCIFLLLTGISCNLSRNNFLRCVDLICASAILTSVTYMVDQIMGIGDGYYFVVFGIIQMMTVSVIIITLIKFFFKNDLYLIMFAAGLLIATLALVHMGVAEIEWLPDSFGWVAKEHLRRKWMAPTNTYMWLDMFIGFIRFGGDWFGIIPNTAVILLGAAIGSQLYKNKRTLLPLFDHGNWHAGIGFVGRNTLWVYIFHQPAMYGVVFLIGYFAGAL